MLKRQQAALALIAMAGRRLRIDAVVELAFLLGKSADVKSVQPFYFFVPCKSGPDSFALRQDLANMQRKGLISIEGGYVSPLGDAPGDTLAKLQRSAPALLERMGVLSASSYEATRREQIRAACKADNRNRALLAAEARKLGPAVFTAGYEGKSVDAFFCSLLDSGIRRIVDVRANPVSRQFGFAKRRLSSIAQQMGLAYQHEPDLGIPGKYRAGLSGYEAYQRLLDKYERELLARAEPAVDRVGEAMAQEPSVLVCVERDVSCCHRSRLAKAVSFMTGMQIKHI